MFGPLIIAPLGLTMNMLYGTSMLNYIKEWTNIYSISTLNWNLNPSIKQRIISNSVGRIKVMW